MNKQSCLWKPACRYVHPEDGEFMPVRSTQRQSIAKLCYYPDNCPRGGPGICSFLHPSSSTNQGFTHTDLSRPPPGYRPNQTHQRYNASAEVQQRGWVNIRTPEMHTATDCPNLWQGMRNLSL